MTEIVRTKTEVKGPLTKDELARLKEHANKWLGYVFRTDHIDENVITPIIENMYEAADLPKPKVVVTTTSTLTMAFAYGASAELLKNKILTKNPREYHSYTKLNVIQKEIIRVVSRIVGPLPDIEDSVISDTWKYSEDSMTNDAAKVCFALAGKEGLIATQDWPNHYNAGNMWGQYNSYLTAFRDVLGLELEIYEKYQWYEKAAIHGGFRVHHADFCIVCDFPEIIKLDAENRSHNENGPTHRFRDGYYIYHWHGVEVPSEWIEDKGSLTATVAITWPNIEQRRAACEIVGWSRILEELNAKVIDTDVDPMVGQLLEVELPDSGKEKFLRVLCGTGRLFALPVPPDMETALQAQAWIHYYDDPNDFTPPEVRT